MNDERFTALEEEQSTMQKAAKAETQALIDERQALTLEQNQGLAEQEQTQQDLIDRSLEQQQQRTDILKQEATEDFQEEAKGAYGDYQRFIDPYGVQAEQQAAEGVAGTGYAESSKVRAYQTYQTRYTEAKNQLNDIQQNYNLAMNDAILQGDIQKADIALQLYQQKMANKLSEFDFTSNMIMTQINTDMAIAQDFYGRQQDLIGQINYEQAFAYEQEQDKIAQSQWERQFAESQRAQRISEAQNWASINAAKEEELDLNNTISTPYYQGNINPDAQYGTFSNGYQPDNVGGKKLTKTGDTVNFDTQVIYGEDAGTKKSSTQNIWQTADGQKYYWEGRENRYIPV